MGKVTVAKAILKLAIPVICGMMVQVLYNLVDTFFIGLLKDEKQLWCYVKKMDTINGDFLRSYPYVVSKIYCLLYFSRYSSFSSNLTTSI